LLLLALLSSGAHAATKEFVISAIRVSDLHEPAVGDEPELRIRCHNTLSPPTELGNILMQQIKDIDKWYMIEQGVFEWNDATMGNVADCEIYESEGLGGIGDETLGTAPLNFNQLVYDPPLRMSTLEAEFYVRCGNCAPTNYAATSLVSKNMWMKTVKVSDTMDTIGDPDIYMECGLAGNPSTYTIELESVNQENTEFTIEKPIGDWVWTVGFDQNGTLLPDSMSHSATCALYERDSTDKDDAIGVTLVHFADITPEGKSYQLLTDPNSYIVLYNCDDPTLCNGSVSLGFSLAVIFLGFLLVFV